MSHLPWCACRAMDEPVTGYYLPRSSVLGLSSQRSPRVPATPTVGTSRVCREDRNAEPTGSRHQTVKTAYSDGLEATRRKWTPKRRWRSRVRDWNSTGFGKYRPESRRVHPRETSFLVSNCIAHKRWTSKSAWLSVEPKNTTQTRTILSLKWIVFTLSNEPTNRLTYQSFQEVNKISANYLNGQIVFYCCR